MPRSMGLSQNIIYALVDPRDCEWRYIGQSTQGITRPKRHFAPANLRKDDYKNHWIKQWFKEGDRAPLNQILILEEFDSREPLNEAEKEWIAAARRAGCRLTNLTDGGASPKRPPHQATHSAKIAAALRGKPKTREARINLSRAGGGTPVLACRLLDGKECVFESQSEAARRLHLTSANITGVLFGRHSHAGGYRFKRIKDGVVSAEQDQAAFPYLPHQWKRLIRDEAGRIYKSTAEAASQLGLATDRISRVLRGKRKTYRGHTFQYVDQTEVSP